VVGWPGAAMPPATRPPSPDRDCGGLKRPPRPPHRRSGHTPYRRRWYQQQPHRLVRPLGDGLPRDQAPSSSPASLLLRTRTGRLAAPGGRLHRSGDPRTGPRDAEGPRRAIASLGHRTAAQRGEAAAGPHQLGHAPARLVPPQLRHRAGYAYATVPTVAPTARPSPPAIPGLWATYNRRLCPTPRRRDSCAGRTAERMSTKREKSLLADSLWMLVQEPDVDPARVPQAARAPIRRHRRRDGDQLDGFGDQPSPCR